MTVENLKLLREIPVNDINKNDLVDISSVAINKHTSKDTAFLSCLDQVKNPYCFKCGEIVVKLQFSENGRTLQECMADAITMQNEIQ